MSKKELKNWTQYKINNGILWTRYRIDGTKKVQVTYCTLHKIYIVRTYLLPSCQCCNAVATIHHVNSQQSAKRMATAWLKY